MNKIVLIGKPNVGKSTLFNRLSGDRQALTTNIPGTTRDINEALISFGNARAQLIDTAGYEKNLIKPLSKETRAHFEASINDADLFVFVGDAETGLTTEDSVLAEFLRKRKQNKPIILVVNKADRNQDKTSDFFRLGFGDPFLVSAVRGSGLATLKKEIFGRLPKEKIYTVSPVKSQALVSILGRPNVGKTSLTNCLLGNQKYIVSEIPGTTRDINVATISHNGEEITFWDTAGLRKRGKIGQAGQNIIEKFSAERTRAAIAASQVCILLIDPTEKITSQDCHIAGEIVEAGKGIIIVVNKWDLSESFVHGYNQVETFIALAKKKFEFAPYAPIVFTSSKTGKNISKILDLILETRKSQTQRVKTHELNSCLQEILARSPEGLKRAKIKYVQQIAIEPPTFQFFAAHPEKVHFSFQRYLENRLREKWLFLGSPVKLYFKAKS